MSKTKELPTLESFFQTENEHFNYYAFLFIRDIKNKGMFEKLESAISLYQFGVDTFLKNPKQPLKALDLMQVEFEKHECSQKQIIFILDSIGTYIARTDWSTEKIDEETSNDFAVIFEADIKQRKLANKFQLPEQTNVGKLRENLKGFLLHEVEQIPEYLKDMEPKDRLAFITKLMPFILPKLEKIHPERGEPNAPFTVNM